MKKQIKRIGLAMVVIFALLGAGGTALAAVGYITWGGSQAYNEALQNLSDIGSRGQQLKAERDTAKASNGQLENIIRDKENIIKDKDNQINAKVQEIEAKQKEIDALRNQNTAESGQLQQAEKDMKDVNQKTKDVLNSLN